MLVYMQSCSTLVIRLVRRQWQCTRVQSVLRRFYVALYHTPTFWQLIYIFLYTSRIAFSSCAILLYTTTTILFIMCFDTIRYVCIYSLVQTPCTSIWSDPGKRIHHTCTRLHIILLYLHYANLCTLVFMFICKYENVHIV